MRNVHFSPYLLVVALSPVFLQTSTPLSCKSGDTTLSELAIIVDGEDQIVGFDPAQQSYSVPLPLGTDEVLVHTVSTDPDAQVWVDVLVEDERLRYLHGGLGGGDIIVPLPKGASTVEVWVRPPGGATDFYEVAVQIGLPCTEDALRQAVADGGGPYVFDCEEPIVTTSPIYIDNDVKLDGLGTLVVSGANDHRVFRVDFATVEFRGMTIKEGSTTGPVQGTGVMNFGGDVTIVDSTLSDNFRGAALVNSGNLTVINSVITRNTDAYGGGGIAMYEGSLSVTDSVVSDNASEWYGGIGVNGTATIVRTLVTRNEATLYGGGGIGCGDGCEATIIDSTFSDNRAAQHAGGIGVSRGGQMTVIGSTIAGNEASANVGGVGSDLEGTLQVTNSTVSGNHSGGNGGGIWVGPGGTGAIVNTTVTDNAALQASGIGGFGDLEVASSIVVGDCAFLGPTAPVFTDTLEGTPTGASSEGTCLGSLVVPEADLALGPLEDNGGPTATHALLPGSVAIDAVPLAMCEEAADQRGVSRPQGTACDAGAFEAQRGQFSCTEQGIRDAIATGDGPHTFDCAGPTVVPTAGEIVIDNNVTLDGQGNLIADAGGSHRVFSVPEGVTAELIGFTLTGGTTVDQGGGIANQGTLTLTSCAMTANQARWGGGVHNRAPGRLTLVDSSVSNNTATSYGGGIYNHNDAIAEVLNTVVSSNVAMLAAGGISNRPGANINIASGIVEGNAAQDGNGGGVQNAGVMTMSQVTVSSNTSPENGGGIYNEGTLRLVDTVVAANTSGSHGGGIQSVLGSAELIGSTLSDNESRIGGGIQNSVLATLSLTNSTVSGNRADDGGAVSSTGTIALANTTVANNESSVPGAPAVRNLGSFVMRNTIVEGDCLASPLISSVGGNIESPGNTCGFNQLTDHPAQTTAALNLGPLQDNGGPTETHALGAGSVAIDQIPAVDCVDAEGAPLTTDQRSEPRDSMCDVGAFEVQP